MFSAMFDMIFCIFGIFIIKDLLKFIINFKTWFSNNQFNFWYNYIKHFFFWCVLGVYLLTGYVFANLMNVDMSVINQNSTTILHLSKSIGHSIFVLSIISFLLSYGYYLFYKSK